jgi:DNA-directed RNA polymerase subunit RPC12/RpoP
MSELVEIACPRCGTRWWVDPSQLEGPMQVVYRDPDRSGRVESYRVRCPACGTYIVVDIEMGEGNDG